jgi:hypothetical protein
VLGPRFVIKGCEGRLTHHALARAAGYALQVRKLVEIPLDEKLAHGVRVVIGVA